MANKYDRIEIDIEKAHLDFKKPAGNGRFTELSYMHKLAHRAGVYSKMINSGFFSGWFEDFSVYWSIMLQGRPLNFHDFFFLLCDYRKNFQDVAVSEDSNKAKFINAWQDYRNIYLTFAGVYRTAINPFVCLQFKEILKATRGGSILEYGCGMAPIITSMLKNGYSNYHLTIADIRGFTYHYAKWQLSVQSVDYIDIIPFEIPNLSRKYDVIFLMTVIEHLPNPYEVVHMLLDRLNVGGYLVFDYILSEGKGLDTMQGLTERTKVLQYIENNLVVVSGSIDYQLSMGTTIVQK